MPLVLAVLRSALNAECNSPSLFLVHFFQASFILILCILDGFSWFRHHVKSKISIKMRNKLYVLAVVRKSGQIKNTEP